jgi:hypothetical protein
LGELTQAFFGQIQLRQDAVGDGQQILPSLRQLQVAAFATPDFCAQLLLQFSHGVAKGGLSNVQHGSSGGQGPLLVNLLDDGQMDAL